MRQHLKLTIHLEDTAYMQLQATNVLISCNGCNVSSVPQMAPIPVKLYSFILAGSLNPESMPYLRPNSAAPIIENVSVPC